MTIDSGWLEINEKVPEVIRLQGRNNRGTTLVALRAKPLSDSNKSKADNGATVLHYCPKGSQSQLGKQSALILRIGSHHPPTLWNV